jgi:hypothetical protein
MDRCEFYFVKTGAIMGRTAIYDAFLESDLDARGFDIINLGDSTGFSGRNVVGYGADPSGVLDSTEAIQGALDDAGADGGAVYLPKGTYLSSRLSVTGGARMMGDGMSRSVLKRVGSDGDNGGFLQVLGKGSVLEGFALDDNSRGRMSCTGTALTALYLNADDITVRGVKVYNSTQDGIALGAGRNIVVEGCVVVGCEGEGIATFGWFPHEGCKIRNNFVGWVGYDGISVSGKGIEVSGNFVIGSKYGDTGIYLPAFVNKLYSSKILVRGNTVMDCGEGIEISADEPQTNAHRVDAVVVEGNVFTNNYHSGGITGVSGSCFKGNVFLNNGGSDSTSLVTAQPQMWATGGAGYAVGNILRVNGGIVQGGGLAGLLRVRAIGAGGSISYTAAAGLQNLATTAIYMGDYDGFPQHNGTLSFTSITGSGAGAVGYMGGVNVVNGGSGYLLHESVTMSGGTYKRQTVIRVEGVDVSGGITAVSVLDGGVYSSAPADGATGVPDTSNGTGATFGFSWRPVVISGTADPTLCAGLVLWGANLNTISGNFFGNEWNPPNYVTAQNYPITMLVLGLSGTSDHNAITSNVFYNNQTANTILDSGTGNVIANNISYP